jgi:zinc transport system substrate-binding protein
MIQTRYILTIQNFVSLLFITAVIISLSTCSSKESENSKQLPVFVSIEPQKYFVERIGGQYVDVNVMVKQGQNPATYEPSPVQISLLGKAAVFFSISVPFEKAFINKISSNLPDLNIADTSQGIIKRKITGHDHEDEDHDEDHDEEEYSSSEDTEETDPHVWMSPLLVKHQISSILTELIELDPDHKEYFEKNYRMFINDLDEVHLDLTKSLSPLKGSTMFVYHPSFGYFADLYGLKQLAIEEAGKEPSPRILEAIIKKVVEENVKVIFVQPEFQSSSINVLTEATGAAVISVNPLSPDYLENLRYIAETLRNKLENL